MSIRPSVRGVALAAMSLILGACSSGGTTSTAPTHTDIDLLWHGGAPSQAQTMQGLVATFNDTHPDITVRYTVVPASGVNYDQAVNLAAVAGKLACVVSFDGPYVPNYAWSGYLQPLDSYVSSSLRSDLLPSIVKAGTYNKKLYAIQLTETGLALTTRKSWLTAAGLRVPDVSSPWTKAEFQDALQKLKALPGIKYALDWKLNYGSGEYYTFEYSPIIQSFGGDLINRSDYKSADGALNGPAAVSAMQWFMSTLTSGLAAPATNTDDNLMAEGKAAMTATPYWSMFPGVDTMPIATTLGSDLAVLPMPDFGSGPKTDDGDWALGMASSCQHKAEAATFINWIFNLDHITKYSGATQAIPALQSALATSEWATGKPANVYIQQIQKGWAVPRPVTPAYPTITSVFSTAFGNILAGGSIQSELDNAVNKINSDLKNNNYYAPK